MKQLYALIAMLMMASVAFTGCVSDDGDTTDPVIDDIDDGTDDGTNGTDDGTNGTDDGTDDGTVIIPVGTESTSTLDDVIAAGEMKCGVKTSQFGMGYLADDGTRSGLDIEYCRAVAAAIGLDPDTQITYVLATGSNRFELLSSGDIDVLIRTTTWTTSRDADLNADFAGINFYDGQGMLVNLNAHPGATSIMDLADATVCVGIGTTTEGNLADYFQVNNIAYTAVNSADADAAKASFTNEECSAWTGDMSAMVAQKYGMEQGAGQSFDMAIMSELMSKEPLGAATRDNDADWNDVVTWVWYGMLTAEELGVDSTNFASQNLSNPSYNRLLNSSLGLGTEANPLSPTWMQSVLATSGNYYEAYDRSFCDGTGQMANCLIERAGTQNAPHWEGGLQYSPPMR
jgi:general L-amino acid transport system substrate-binding protein